MTQIAIKGHPTKGKEVIEILEMLGGKNYFHMNGFTEEFIYYICEEKDNQIHSAICPTNQIVFTIEKYLEKYPYKVGDKVVVKGLSEYPKSIHFMKWFDDNIHYSFDNETWFLPSALNPYKEETMEEQKKDYEEWFQINYLEFENNDDTWADEVEVNLGKDYEIQIRGDKTFIVKKQLQLPKTYAECCDVLSIPPYYNLRYHTYERGYQEYTTINKLCSLQDKLNTLGKLLICRDAYWQIAGEQMGLGEPWKPNWLDTEQDKFVLYIHNNIICSNRFVLGHNVLAFPTKEMHDIFFENFNDLIESCKELL